MQVIKESMLNKRKKVIDRGFSIFERPAIREELGSKFKSSK
jgi:hypothetical protein